MSRAQQHRRLALGAAVPQHGASALGEAECVPAAGMSSRGDKCHQICSANLLQPSENKDPVTTHRHGLSPPLYAHAVEKTHSQSPPVTSPGGDVPSASCRMQAGAWQSSSINPFLFLCLGEKVLHPGTIMGSSFEEASLLHSELAQKMTWDSEIQGLAESQEFRTDLPWWTRISKGAKVGSALSLPLGFS